jgi:hypothetical protein
MTKIVKMKVSQARISQGREPHPAAEVRVPRRAPTRAREEQAVVFSADESREVPGKIRHDEIRKHDGPLSGLGLGRPESDPPPGDSASCRNIRTVRASRSMSQRRSAASSAQRKLPKTASRIGARYLASIHPSQDKHLAEGEHWPLR